MSSTMERSPVLGMSPSRAMAYGLELIFRATEGNTHALHLVKEKIEAKIIERGQL